MRLVASREIRDRFGRPSYYVITGLFVLLILVVGMGARLTDGTGNRTFRVAVVGNSAPDFAQTLDAVETGTHLDLVVSTPRNRTTAVDALTRGDVDVVVATGQEQLLVTDQDDATGLAIVQRAWAVQQEMTALGEAGLTSAQIDHVLAPAPLEVTTVGDDGGDTSAAVISGTLAAVLLFLSLQIFGGQILGGVVEEKSSSVVEVLLARVEPRELLGGKVIGIGVAALAQFAAMAVAGIAALLLSGTSVPTGVWAMIPMTLVWFVCGFALYAMAFALAGALVSRQEDAQAAAAPVTAALIVAYGLIFLIAGDPESTAARMLSLLPPTAPLLMPLRIATGSAAPIEVVLALAVLVAAIVGVWRFTANVYAQVLLRRGARITWSAAWAIARGDKR